MAIEIKITAGTMAEALEQMKGIMIPFPAGTPAPAKLNIFDEKLKKDTGSKGGLQMSDLTAAWDAKKKAGHKSADLAGILKANSVAKMSELQAEQYAVVLESINALGKEAAATNTPAGNDASNSGASAEELATQLREAWTVKKDAGVSLDKLKNLLAEYGVKALTELANKQPSKVQEFIAKIEKFAA